MRTKSVLSVLLLSATLALVSCQNPTPTQSAVQVGVGKAAAVAVVDILDNKNELAVPDAVASALDTLHTQTAGKSGYAILEASARAALAGWLAHEDTKTILVGAGKAAALASLTAMIKAPAAPVPLSAVPPVGSVTSP
jgi:hypothetical protein